MRVSRLLKPQVAQIVQELCMNRVVHQAIMLSRLQINSARIIRMARLWLDQPSLITFALTLTAVSMILSSTLWKARVNCQATLTELLVFGMAKY